MVDEWVHRRPATGGWELGKAAARLCQHHPRRRHRQPVQRRPWPTNCLHCAAPGSLAQLLYPTGCQAIARSAKSLTPQHPMAAEAQTTRLSAVSAADGCHQHRGEMEVLTSWTPMERMYEAKPQSSALGPLHQRSRNTKQRQRLKRQRHCCVVAQPLAFTIPSTGTTLMHIQHFSLSSVMRSQWAALSAPWQSAQPITPFCSCSFLMACSHNLATSACHSRRI